MNEPLEVLCQVCSTYVPFVVDVHDVPGVWPVTECCAWCAHKLEYEPGYLQRARNVPTNYLMDGGRVLARLIRVSGGWRAEPATVAGVTPMHRATSRFARSAWATLAVDLGVLAAADDATRNALRAGLAKAEVE